MQKDFEKAKKYVLWLFGKKDYSENEIVMKLKQKNYDEKIIKKILSFIKEYNIIDENRIINSTIEKHTKYNLQSPYIIRKKLLQKGINKDKIEEKLKDIDEFEIAYQIALKKKKKLLKNKENCDIKPYLYKYLSTKGFNYDIIEEVINKIFK
jgi:regulatory protein